MYILRTAFWLSVVILLIPADNGEEPGAANAATEQSALSAGEAVDAAMSTFGDLAGICGREPAVCETGAAAWQVFQRKAINGVQMIYRWTTGDDEAGADAQTVPVGSQAQLRMLDGIMVLADNEEPLHTGSTSQPAAQTQPAPSSQNTLRLEDLIPEWTGPGSEDKERA